MSEPKTRTVINIDLVALGHAVAAAISYNTQHHIGWSILHGIFGWFYVLFYYFTGSWQGTIQ